MQRALSTLIAITLAAPALNAQEAPPAASPTGSVTGHVLAQDTQRPVRFAMVLLQNTAAVNGNHDDASRYGGGGSAVRTDAEGNFSVASIAPGDYYVTAASPGYIPERAMLQAQVNAGADPAALLAQIPIVHVAVNSTSTVTVNIDRGGAIGGKLQWEDGSPAAGITLNAISTTATAGQQLPAPLQNFQSAGGGAATVSSDDRGVFRLTGLPAGKYLLRAAIAAPAQVLTQFLAQPGGLGRSQMFGSPIRIYAPGVFRKSEARIFEIKPGEDRNDVNIVLDLRSLHSVSGTVVSATAGQAVASGRVTLADPNDSDLQLAGSIAPNGDFTVRYVPAGNYTLRVSGASTQPGSGRGRGDRDHAFQPFSQALIVGDTDISGDAITLTPADAQQ